MCCAAFGISEHEVDEGVGDGPLNLSVPQESTEMKLTGGNSTSAARCLSVKAKSISRVAASGKISPSGQQAESWQVTMLTNLTPRQDKLSVPGVISLTITPTKHSYFVKANEQALWNLKGIMPKLLKYKFLYKYLAEGKVAVSHTRFKNVRFSQSWKLKMVRSQFNPVQKVFQVRSKFQTLFTCGTKLYHCGDSQKFSSVFPSIFGKCTPVWYVLFVSYRLISVILKAK